MQTETESPRHVGSSALVRRRLWLTLTMPGMRGYWHCHKRKRLPPLRWPKTVNAPTWPGKGITFQTACDIDIKAGRIRGAGKYEVECGRYIITAHWRKTPNDQAQRRAPGEKVERTEGER